MSMHLYLCWALCVAVAQGVQRYGAVDSNGLVPRYFVDPAFPLARRADSCAEGRHSCEDIGHGGRCCENTRYCFIDNDGDPGCCPIGSNCLNQNVCSSDRYFCTSTVSVASGTASAQPGCCPRTCPGTSEYQCASSLGGGCCGYDSECRSDGNCVRTLQPSSTPTGAMTPVAEGCTTSQYRCDDGAGCCDNDEFCTAVSGTGYCAAGRPTQTDVEPAGSDGGGLSDGAKVGIGVGAVVGAGLIIGGLTWMCIRKKRERRQTLAHPPSESHGEAQDQTNMTEITAASRRQNTGLTQDYFGPDPVPGPFTETAATARSPDSTSGPHRAVPHRPEHPGDIAAAVEMDSNSHLEGGRMSPSSQPSYFTNAVPIHSIDGTYELDSPDPEHRQPPRSPSLVATPAGYSPKRET